MVPYVYVTMVSYLIVQKVFVAHLGIIDYQMDREMFFSIVCVV